MNRISCGPSPTKVAFEENVAIPGVGKNEGPQRLAAMNDAKERLNLLHFCRGCLFAA
jgi:hypothetical protein